MQQVVTNRQDTTTGQIQTHEQTSSHVGPTPLVSTVSTFHPTHQTKELALNAICRSPNHDTKACRKFQNNNHSPTNSHIPTGYHPTATPPPLLGTATTGTTGTATQGPWFQNHQDPHQPRHNTTTAHTPFDGTSPAPSANMTEALDQILAQVTNNKKDEVSKQMMKNIKIFDGTNKAEMHHMAQPRRGSSQV